MSFVNAYACQTMRTHAAQSLVELSREFPSLRFRQAIPGRNLSTMAVGGPCELLVEVTDEASLTALMASCASHAIPYRVLGAGSNVLLPDEGISNILLRLTGDFRACEDLGEGRFRVGAAHALMPLARKLSSQGFAGLEFAGGIPASLGGAAYMNAGAHGSDMSAIICGVHLMHPGGWKEFLPREGITFAYRSSSLRGGEIITAVELELHSDDPTRIERRLQDALAERKARQPLSLPSAGSVFQNPSAKQSAGGILDACGMRGRRMGGAEVSSLHANWIVNPKKTATAKDVLALMESCEQAALGHMGITLHREIRCWENTQDSVLLWNL